MLPPCAAAGLMALPSRDAFMQAIGESEESARQSALAIIQHAQQVISKIEALYDGVSMPKSNFTMW